MAPQMGSSDSDPKLIGYLRANRGQAAFLVATESAGDASPLILAAGEPVMALGGFGGDKILTADQLAARVRDGQIRFFLLAGADPPILPGIGGQANQLAAPPENDVGEWVREHCARVPEELWQSTPQRSSAGNVQGMLGHSILYDCGSHAR